MKKLISYRKWTILFAVASAITLFSCGGTSKKDFAIKGNVQITNTCGGQIPDTIVVKISFIDDSKQQVDTDTAWAYLKDGFYPFKKTSNVNEDAVKCRIIEVNDANGSAICGAARNHACKSPQTCKGTLSSCPVVSIGMLMTCDVACACAK